MAHDKPSPRPACPFHGKRSFGQSRVSRTGCCGAAAGRTRPGGSGPGLLEFSAVKRAGPRVTLGRLRESLARLARTAPPNRYKPASGPSTPAGPRVASTARRPLGRNGRPISGLHTKKPARQSRQSCRAGKGASRRPPSCKASERGTPRVPQRSVPTITNVRTYHGGRRIFPARLAASQLGHHSSVSMRTNRRLIEPPGMENCRFPSPPTLADSKRSRSSRTPSTGASKTMTSETMSPG